MGKKKGALPDAPKEAPATEQFDMVFHVQLAHGSPTRQVRDFTNVKQLYESIAKAFGIPTTDVRLHHALVRLLYGMHLLLRAHARLAEGSSSSVKSHQRQGIPPLPHCQLASFTAATLPASIISWLAFVGAFVICVR